MDSWSDFLPDEEKECSMCEGSGFVMRDYTEWMSTRPNRKHDIYKRCPNCNGLGKGGERQEL